MENRKDFITKDAELKYLRERVSYLELENENLRLKLKLQENEKPQQGEKKVERFPVSLIKPFNLIEESKMDSFPQTIS